MSDVDVKDVIVRDFANNTISSFWQYGLINWEQFYNYLRTIIVYPPDWAVFQYDENVPERHGVFFPSGPKLPEPGGYILLSPSGSPITVGLTAFSARPRHPTISNTATRTEHYQRRVRARDPCCLISGIPVVRGDFSRFKASHVYPRAHSSDWVSSGCPSCITDPAPLNELGGPTKIDSVQNMILLRSDLHDAWDSYKLAVNPDRGYQVVPFVAGYDDIAGRTLKLDHITDTKLRPLDELFRDHFLQGVLKNMKGAGEPNWDYEDALGNGMMDLSRSDVWGSKYGKEHLEFEIAHRLHSAQQS